MGTSHASPALLEGLEHRLMMSADGAAWLGAPPSAVDLPPAGAIMAEGSLDRGGDEALYTFTTPARGRLRVELDADGVGFTPRLELLNANGQRLRRRVARGGDCGFAKRTGEGRTFTVRVRNVGSLAGDFSLRVVSDPKDDRGNSPDNADLLSISRDGSGGTKGRIDYGQDVDMLSIVAPVTGELSVSMEPRGRGDALECELVAADEAGNELASDLSFGSSASTVTFRVTAGEVYHLSAAGVGQSTGRYRIHVDSRRAAPVVPGPEPQPTPEPEPTPDAQDDPVVAPGPAVQAEVRQAEQGTILLVAGTDQADEIIVAMQGDALLVNDGEFVSQFTEAVDAVVIYGFGGDDVIRIDHTLSVEAWMFGGDDDDSLFDAGMARAVLDGGAGDDLLVSIGGRADYLVGGEGFDSFWADDADRIDDASALEQSLLAVHRVRSFYQPVTNNPASAAYVSMDIAGQNLPDPAVTSYADGWVNLAHVPLFAGEADYTDIEQGYVGDCYFLASLAGYAETDPYVIEQMIAPLGDGTYAVRFFRDGQEVYLRLDADLPTRGNGLAYANVTADSGLWVALAEKAYAFFRYELDSYGSIQGGWMTTVYEELTGQRSLLRWTSTRTAEQLYDYIDEQLSAGHTVSLGSRPGGAGPIVGSHAYTVLSAETVEGQQYVTVYNPWSVDGRSHDDNPDDGVLRLSADQVKAAYIAVAVSLV